MALRRGAVMIGGDLIETVQAEVFSTADKIQGTDPIGRVPPRLGSPLPSKSRPILATESSTVQRLN